MHANYSTSRYFCNWYKSIIKTKVIDLWETFRTNQDLYLLEKPFYIMFYFVNPMSNNFLVVTRHRSPPILLRRSDREGCLLAPYLYLFISEAFSFFLNRSDARIRSLVVPHASKNLLDSKYADDTMLYLQGNDANLQKAESRI